MATNLTPQYHEAEQEYKKAETPAEEEPDLPPDLHIKRQCELVWISDFLQPLDSIEAALKRLAYSGAHGYLVQIIDPAEEDFPFTGRARFEARTIRDTAVLGRAETVKTNYRKRYDAHSEAVGQYARRVGWSFLRHRTDHSPATALIGLYGALGGARLIRSLLYGVRPTDVVTFFAVSLVLAAVALMASYLPARRASRVDPMIALRYE